MANKRNINKLMAALRDHEITYEGKQVGFNMLTWFTDGYNDHSGQEPPCGTVACIGGSAEILFFPKEVGQWVPLLKIAQKLGITYQQANNLCYPSLAYNNVSLVDALDVLEKLKETGRVNWASVRARQKKEERVSGNN